MISIDRQGGFLRHGQPIVPCGVNYWPASCGVEMLRAWPEDEIRRDLDAVAALGLNCVRFFLRWDHVEPELGRFDEACFERLRRFVALCAERGILAHPCLFVGFMSGGQFWPAGKGRRNMFTDEGVAARCAEQVARVAAVLHAVPGHVLALDLGNEPGCHGDSQEAGPAGTAAWCARMKAAASAACPGLLVCVGMDNNQVVNELGWRLDRQPGMDFLSMHGYPVPAWHPIAFDGMSDPLAQDLLPAYTACARAFGPVMLQEFGTIITNGAAAQAAYLGRMLPECRAAGANGFLWWCLRDISARVFPYTRGGFERRLGLIDAEGRVKPGCEVFLDFARELARKPAAPPLPDGDIGIYWPRQWYGRGDAVPMGNRPRELARRLLAAWHLARRCGRSPRIVRGDQAFEGIPPILINAGGNVDIDEAAALAAWVRGGGQLLWHGVDHVSLGEDMEGLLGARPIDHRSALPARVEAFGGRFAFAAYPRDTAMEMDAGEGRVIACDQRGLPVAVLARRGAGRVLWTTPLVEEAFVAEAGDREARTRWDAWYAGELAALTS